MIKKIVHLLYPLHPYRGSSLHHLFVWVETQQRGMELSVLLFNLSPQLYPTMGKRLHIPKEKPAGGPHKVRSYCCYVCSLLQKALFFHLNPPVVPLRSWRGRVLSVGMKARIIQESMFVTAAKCRTHPSTHGSCHTLVEKCARGSWAPSAVTNASYFVIRGPALRAQR